MVNVQEAEGENNCEKPTSVREVRDSHPVKGMFMPRLKDWGKPAILMWMCRWFWENMN